MHGFKSKEISMYLSKSHVLETKHDEYSLILHLNVDLLYRFLTMKHTEGETRTFGTKEMKNIVLTIN